MESADFKAACTDLITWTGRSLEAQARENIYNNLIREKLRLNFSLQSNRDTEY